MNDGHVAEARRFLVVEGYADLAEALRMGLECRGHEVRTARSGELALMIVATFSPDVVLLDLSLFERDELGLLGQLRHHANARHARMIAVSGGDEVDDHTRIRGHGFDVFLTKPFYLDSVIDLILPPARPRT